MKRTPISNTVAVTMLRNPANCATLAPAIKSGTGVQDRCRNNRATLPAATFKPTQEVQYP